jgi:uncharacterized protein YndB with AHSA1/START domain
MKSENSSNGRVLTIVRKFDAPRSEVFSAFADADALNEWWGPADCKNSVVKLDFRPGGIFHYKMECGGRINYGRFLFSVVQPNDLLEFTNAFADEKATIVQAPFDIQLPLEIFYRFIFTEHDGKTTITMTGQAVNATDKEQETFNSIDRDMQEGFKDTFDQLEKYLAKIRNYTR